MKFEVVKEKSDPVEVKERSAGVKRAPKDPRILNLKQCLKEQIDFLHEFSRTSLRHRMTSVEKLERFADLIRKLELLIQ